jgi:O-antigen/teichoic acid export membrane protein
MKTSQRLMNGAALRLIAFAVAVLSTLIVMPILIHELGNHLYGLWALIGSIVAYYEFFDLGLGVTTQRFLAKSFQSKNPNAANSTYSTALFLFSILGLFFALLSILISSLSVYFFEDPQDAHLFGVCILLLGLNFATKVPFYAVEGAIAAKLRYDIIAITRIAIILLRTILLVSAVKMGHSLVAIALIMVGLTIVNRAILYVAFRKLAPNLKFTHSAVRRSVAMELVSHGKYIFLSNISKNAQFRISNILVSSIMGLNSVAVYSVAARLSEYLKILVYRVFQMTVPVFASFNAQQEKKQLDQAFWMVNHLNIVFVVASFGLGAILGPSFIALWLGPGFEDSFQIFLILLLGLVPQQVQSTSAQALIGVAKHKWANLSDTLESVLGVGAAVVLGSKFGLIGIAVGIILPGALFKIFVYPTLVCKGLSISLSEYYRAIAIGAAPILIALAPTYILVKTLSPLSLIQLALCGFGGIILTYLAFVISLPRTHRTFLSRRLPTSLAPLLSLTKASNVD